jgi:hypothetical protein
LATSHATNVLDCLRTPTSVPVDGSFPALETAVVLSVDHQRLRSALVRSSVLAPGPLNTERTRPSVVSIVPGRFCRSVAR